MKLSELFTNADGRVSTTGTIQFLTFIGLIGTLCYCVYLDRPYVPDLFSTLALFGVGGAATKGAVNAVQNRYQDRYQNRDEYQDRSRGDE